MPMFRVLLVCEGPSDLPLAREVLAHWIRAGRAWFADVPDDELMATVGESDTDPYLPTRRAKAFAADRKVAGFGAALPAGDAGTLRALLLALHEDPKVIADRVDVVVWLRDSDGAPHMERDARDQRGRDSRLVSVPVVIGYAHQCGEAWVIAGFQPSGPDEEERAEEVRQNLKRPHRTRVADLTHKDVPLRGAKAVARHLVADDPDRRIECIRYLLENASSERRAVGLEAFLQDLTDHWGPKLGTAP